MHPLAAAQAPAPQNKEKPKAVEVSVELRLRNEFRDNADFKPADDFDHYLGQRLRINLRARLHPRFQFFFQGQDAWAFDSKSDKIIHDLATNLHQAYFDWKLTGTDRWEFRGGRQEFIYGEERLVGGVQPQAVEMKLLQPVKRVVDEEGAHGFAARAVEIDAGAPGRLVAVGEELGLSRAAIQRGFGAPGNEIWKLRNRRGSLPQANNTDPLDAKDVAGVKAAMPQTFSIIDRAARWGIIKSNTAARYKSRLTLRVNALA